MHRADRGMTQNTAVTAVKLKTLKLILDFHLLQKLILKIL